MLTLLAAVRVFFRSRSDTALEILALRQQVAVLKRKRPRPSLNSFDRLFWTGVVFILYTKLQAARTALRNGRSVNSTAGPHRSLRARARSCTMCSPVASFHLAPQRFIRTSNRLLQVASALPLPTGRPSRRARA